MADERPATANTDPTQILDQAEGRRRSLLGQLDDTLDHLLNTGSPVQVTGELVRLTGLIMQVQGCRLGIGQCCQIRGSRGISVEAEVVGFDHNSLFLMPYEYTDGLAPGDQVVPINRDMSVPVGDRLFGRVINGAGLPLDDKGPLLLEENPFPLHGAGINPLQRAPVNKALDVGVRSINGLLTVGSGQRLGLFSSPGVGKSTLLGMMARNSCADVIVVAMIGERGREVREFVQSVLGKRGLRRAVVVAAPADHAPVMRLRAALLAHRVAEFFRQGGRQVLLLMDSLTRYAQAQREVALAVGEPPSARGYPPSVFSLISRLVERAGNGQDGQGSITAFYAVLVEGEEGEDPVAEAARAVLDGHIILSHEQAISGLYPAVDLSRSISRTMPACVSEEQVRLSGHFRYLYEQARAGRELAMLGAYQKGNDPAIDKALALEEKMRSYLRQGIQDSLSMEESVRALRELFGDDQ